MIEYIYKEFFVGFFFFITDSWLVQISVDIWDYEAISMSSVYGNAQMCVLDVLLYQMHP